jgi:hypothetical protein
MFASIRVLRAVGGPDGPVQRLSSLPLRKREGGSSSAFERPENSASAISKIVNSRSKALSRPLAHRLEVNLSTTTNFGGG